MLFEPHSPKLSVCFVAHTKLTVWLCLAKLTPPNTPDTPCLHFIRVHRVYAACIDDLPKVLCLAEKASHDQHQQSVRYDLDQVTGERGADEPPNTSGITGARLADSSVTMKVAEVANVMENSVKN